MSEECKIECPKCGNNNLAVERRPNGNAKCLTSGCGWEGPYSHCFQKEFERLAEKERNWFKDRGYREADMMYADAAFKEYQRAEESRPDKRPFDKAPGFRRMFMMGYFYGRAVK